MDRKSSGPRGGGVAPRQPSVLDRLDTPNREPNKKRWAYGPLLFDTCIFFSLSQWRSEPKNQIDEKHS